MKPACPAPIFTSQQALGTGSKDTSPVLTDLFMLSFTLQSSARHCGPSQALNRLKNGSEQLSRDRHFRHLKDDLPGAAHDLRPNHDRFLPQWRQRPVTH
jgi:hypothetical protein